MGYSMTEKYPPPSLGDLAVLLPSLRVCERMGWRGMGWSSRGDGKDALFLKTTVREAAADGHYWLGNELHDLSQPLVDSALWLIWAEGKISEALRRGGS